MTRITWITAGLLALFAGGFLLGTHYSRNTQPRDHPTAAWSPQSGTVYCDDAKTVPFIPAEECGGLTSCDRLFNHLGTCSKPLPPALLRQAQ
jgi:hypothetical protein